MRAKHTYVWKHSKTPPEKIVCYKFSLYNNTKSQKIFEMVVTIYCSFARRLLNFFYILTLRQNSEFHYHEKNGGTIISGETFLIETRELELRSRPPWQADPTQGWVTLFIFSWSRSFLSRKSKLPMEWKSGSLPVTSTFKVDFWPSPTLCIVEILFNLFGSRGGWRGQSGHPEQRMILVWK